MRRFLLIGNGGREHALATALAGSRVCSALYAYMGSPNPGIIGLSKGYKIGEFEELKSLLEFARESKTDIAVVGPEAALAAGVVDALERLGIKCFGPTKEGARLETSKGFTRQIMQKYGIPGLPKFKVFSKITGISQFMDEVKDFVVKPDGLTGGKGVKVLGEHLHSKDDALKYCEEVLGSHTAVIIEERLEGEEFSLMSITDGKTLAHCPAVQDHKRAYDGDSGPNTGGMGSYSDADHSLPFLREEDIKQAWEINSQMLQALNNELTSRYKGVMYGGFIATSQGVKLIEYNARFGDPEAENIFPILETDFGEIVKATVEGRLNRMDVRLKNKATVCKYIVPKGYPGNPQKGGEISIEEGIEAELYYASIIEENGRLIAQSSRSIAVVGIGDTINDAEAACQRGVEKIHGSVFYRRDIGTDALIQKRIAHMKRLRVAEKVIS